MSGIDMSTGSIVKVITPAASVPVTRPTSVAQVTPPNVTINAVPGLQDHVDSLEPHPVYDDLPSLVLTFENGLV